MARGTAKKGRRELLKITLKQIDSSRNALQFLSTVFNFKAEKDEDKVREFSWKEKYKLARIKEAIAKECERIDRHREEMIRGFNHKIQGPQGEVWGIPEEQQAEANRQYDEWLASEVEIWGEAFDLSLWSEEKANQIPVICFEQLMWLWSDGEQKAEGAAR